VLIHVNLLSLYLVSFLVGLRTYQRHCTGVLIHVNLLSLYLFSFPGRAKDLSAILYRGADTCKSSVAVSCFLPGRAKDLSAILYKPSTRIRPVGCWTLRSCPAPVPHYVLLFIFPWHNSLQWVRAPVIHEVSRSLSNTPHSIAL
jgi:hypothetical protein